MLSIFSSDTLSNWNWWLSWVSPIVAFLGVLGTAGSLLISRELNNRADKEKRDNKRVISSLQRSNLQLQNETTDVRKELNAAQRLLLDQEKDPVTEQLKHDIRDELLNSRNKTLFGKRVTLGKINKIVRNLNGTPVLGGENYRTFLEILNRLKSIFERLPVGMYDFRLEEMISPSGDLLTQEQLVEYYVQYRNFGTGINSTREAVDAYRQTHPDCQADDAAIGQALSVWEAGKSYEAHNIWGPTENTDSIVDAIKQVVK